jgi:hypothetical protein
MRITLVIPSLWIAKSYMNYQLWFSISLLAIYGVIIHPTAIHYRLFVEKNREIIESTMCSSCKHFDESAVLCLKHDEHPSREYLPCDGVDWIPSSPEAESKDVDINS